MRISGYLLVIAFGGCGRTTARYAGPVAPEPITPALTVPAIVTQGAAGLTASVEAPIAGLTYEWTIFNGIITTSGRDPTITFTAGGEGLITFTVTAQNRDGKSADVAHAQSRVVAPLPPGYVPQIVTTDEVVAGRGPVAATIGNSQSNAIYRWSIKNGVFAGPSEGPGIGYIANAAGTATLSVSATIAGTSDNGVSATREIVAVDSDHALAVVAGAVGGSGYVDGPPTIARLGYQRRYGDPSLKSPTPIARGADGEIYVYESGVGVVRKLTTDGAMSTVTGPDARLIGGTAMVAEGNGDLMLLAPCQLLRVAAGKITALAANSPTCFGSNPGAYQNAMPLSASTIGGGDQILTNDGNGNLFLGDGNYLIEIAANGAGTITNTSNVTVRGQGSTACADANADHLDSLRGLAATGSLVYMLDQNEANDVLVPRSLSGATFAEAFSGNCAGPNLAGFSNLANVVPMVAVAGDIPAHDTLYMAGTDLSAGAIGLYSNSARLAGAPERLRLGGGSLASGWADGAGANARFGGTLSLALESPSAVLIGDSENGVIRRATNLSAGAAVVTTLGGLPPQIGSSDASPATSARLTHPTLTAVGADGAIYVYQDDNDGQSQTFAKIHRIDKRGMRLLVGASMGERDGPAALARLNHVVAMVMMPSGDLLLFDTSGPSATLRTVSPSGDVRSVTGGLTGSADGAPGIAALGSTGVMALAPNGAAVIGSGNAIRSFGSDGLLSTIAGSGFAGSEDRGADSSFNALIGIAVAPSGVIYAADFDGSAVRLRRAEINAEAVTVTTFTGTSVSPQSSEGACANVNFAGLSSLLALANGDLVVADGAAMKRVTHPDAATCTVTTMVGTAPFIGATPGPLPAIVGNPKGLSLGANGDWIFTDDSAVLRVRE